MSPKGESRYAEDLSSVLKFAKVDVLSDSDFMFNAIKRDPKVVDMLILDVPKPRDRKVNYGRGDNEWYATHMLPPPLANNRGFILAGSEHEPRVLKLASLELMRDRSFCVEVM